MALVGRGICQAALEMLQVYAPGETMSAADAARALECLNDMILSFSNESLVCFGNQIISFPLVVNQDVYTIGPGGDINVERPLQLRATYSSAYMLDQQDNKYMMDVVDEDTWNLRTTSVVTTNLPGTLWYNPKFPLAEINIWGKPTQGFTCVVTADQQLLQFATLQTAFDAPPGYELMLKANLAVYAKPFFKTKPLDTDVRNIASEAKANVKRTNIRTEIAVFDPEIVAKGNSTYNIRTDNAGRN